jgi:dolichol kinase
LAGAAIAALVELLPLGIDDNVAVPLVSGAVMTLMGA